MLLAQVTSSSTSSSPSAKVTSTTSTSSSDGLGVSNILNIFLIVIGILFNFTCYSYFN